MFADFPHGTHSEDEITKRTELDDQDLPGFVSGVDRLPRH